MRPLVSRPTTCRRLRCDGEMRTCFQAGGMTSDLMRSSSVSSVMRLPVSSAYQKPFIFEPCLRHQCWRGPRSTVSGAPPLGLGSRLSGSITLALDRSLLYILWRRTEAVNKLRATEIIKTSLRLAKIRKWLEAVQQLNFFKLKRLDIYGVRL